MVERHLEGILGHWKDGLTTAFLEGLNSLFSATQTQGPWLPLHRVSGGHALLRRGQTGDPLPWLIPITNVEEAERGWIAAHPTERILAAQPSQGARAARLKAWNAPEQLLDLRPRTCRPSRPAGECLPAAIRVVQHLFGGATEPPVGQRQPPPGDSLKGVPKTVPNGVLTDRSLLSASCC